MIIAVTGAGGFIGSEVVRQLREVPGIKILALSRQSDTTNDPSDLTVEKRQTDYSVESLTKILTGVDTVIHLAAIRGTTGSIGDYHANEILTENVLLAMAEAKVQRIVFASSIAVYSDTATIPWKEDMPLAPKTLYGITKASCEYLCMYYAKKAGFSFTILRIAQVLGMGEKRKAMMNIFIDLAMEKKTLKVMGKSVAKRQYIFVDDLATVMVRSALSGDGTSRIMNVGMPAALSNLEIAGIVNEVFENPAPIDYDDSYPETCEASAMDIGVLRDALGIVPKDMKTALFMMKTD